MVNLLQKIGGPVAVALSPLIISSGLVSAGELPTKQPQTLRDGVVVELSKPNINKPLASVGAAADSGDKQPSSPQIDPLKRSMQIVRQSISADPNLSPKPIVVGSRAFAESYLNAQEQQDRLSAQFDGLTIPGSSPK